MFYNNTSLKNVVIRGSSTGKITLNSSAGSNYTLVLPSAQGSASTVLTNDGSGNLTWAAGGGGGGGSTSNREYVLNQDTFKTKQTSSLVLRENTIIKTNNVYPSISGPVSSTQTYTFGNPNNKIWVAGGTAPANTLAYSTDSVNWYGLGASLFTTSCRALCWNGTVWVAGGQGGSTMAYSFDGKGWTAIASSPFSTVCNTICWTGTYFIAGGQGTNTMGISQDGINWTSLSNVFTTSVHAIYWNGYMLVAVGNGTYTIAYTLNQNGTSWIGSSLFSTIGRCLAWTGNLWVAGGDNTSTGAIYWSVDGMSWQLSSSTTFTTSCFTLCWNGSTILAGGSGTNYLAYSSSPKGPWTTISPTTSLFTSCNGVFWNGKIFTAVGTGNNTICSSIDGINWTTFGTIMFVSTGLVVAYNNARQHEINFTKTMAVAVGTGPTSPISYSSNGIVWTVAANTIFTTQGNCCTYGNGLYIAGGEGTNTLAYSTDGKNWTGLGTTVFSTRCSGIAFRKNISPSYSNGRAVVTFVAVGVGGNGNLAYSYDGKYWIPVTVSQGLTTAGKGVCFGNGYWVAVGSGTSSIIYSTDGISWTAAANSPLDFSVLTMNAICYGFGTFVAVGSLGYVVYSSSTSVAPSSWNGSQSFDGGNAVGKGVAFDGKTFVAVGDSTVKVIYSKNYGKTWVNTGIGLLSSGNAVTYFDGKWIIAGETANSIIYFHNILGGSVVGLGTSGGNIFATGYGVHWNSLESRLIILGAGTTNTISHSADGITYANVTSSTSIFGTQGNKATSGTTFTTDDPANIVYAVGAGTNTLAYSLDNSLTYTGLGTTTFSNAGNGIQYVGVIVAVTDNTTGSLNSSLRFSVDDGKTWSSGGDQTYGTSSGETSTINSVTYNGTYFVYGRTDSGLIYFVTRGISGNAVVQSTSATNLTSIYGVRFANNNWMAVGVGTGVTIVYSTASAPTSWSNAASNPFSTAGYCAAYGNGYWVAGGVGGTNLAYTNNIAGSWTNNNQTSLLTILCASYGNGYWVIGGVYATNTIMYRATDPTGAWTVISSNPFSGGACYKVIYANGYWVAVGINTGATVKLAYCASVPSGTWTTVQISDLPEGRSICWTGRNWVIGGYSATKSIFYASSITGSWTASINSTTTSWLQIKDMVYGGSFVSAGDGTNGLAFSNNLAATTWTGDSQLVFGSTKVVHNIIYNGNIWLALGNGTTSDMYYSYNTYGGWFATGGVFTTAYDATYDDLTLVCGNSGTNNLYYNADLSSTTYTASNMGSLFTGGACLGIDFNGKAFVACGYTASNGIIAYSTSLGGTWTAVTIFSGAGSRVTNVKWLNGYWTAIGYNPDLSKNFSYTSVVTGSSGWTDTTTIYISGITYITGITYVTSSSKWVVVCYLNGSNSVMLDSSNLTSWTNQITLYAGTTNGSPNIEYIENENHLVVTHKRSDGNPGCTVYNPSTYSVISSFYFYGDSTGFFMKFAKSYHDKGYLFGTNEHSLGLQLARALNANGPYNYSTIIVNSISHNGKYFIVAGTTALWYVTQAPTTTTSYSYTTLFSSGFIGSFVKCYNRLIAVGEGSTNTLAFSLDNGRNWTGLGKTIFTTEGRGIAYNNTDKWVAVGSGTNSIAYSTNGYDWTGLGTSIFSAAYSVKWNGTRFVAVGNGSNTVAYSSDGITWTGLGTTTLTTGLGLSVTDNETSVEIKHPIIALGQGTDDTIALSFDEGLNWFGIGKSIFTTIGRHALWTGMKYFAVGEGTNTLASSDDGVLWTGLGTSQFSTRGYYLAISRDKIIAAGEGTNTLMYSTSTSGTFTWTACVSPFTTAGRGVYWNGAIYVAVGSGTRQIASSSDGITFVYNSDGIFTTAGYAVIYAAHLGMWIVGGEGTNTIATSTTGTVFTAATSPFTTSCNGLANNGSVIVAVGSGTYTVAYSTNGTSWTGLSVFSASGNSVIWNGNVFIAVGSDTNSALVFKYSYNGSTWYSSQTSQIFDTGVKAIGLCTASTYGSVLTELSYICSQNIPVETETPKIEVCSEVYNSNFNNFAMTVVV